MADALDRVLRLVADGRLTAAQAAPILDALSAADEAVAQARAAFGERDDTDRPPGSARSLRIEVVEGGRKIVNLRIPLSLGRLALEKIPGLSESHVDMVRRALDEGRSGTLLAIDDEDTGVRIALE